MCNITVMLLSMVVAVIHRCQLLFGFYLAHFFSGGRDSKPKCPGEAPGRGGNALGGCFGCFGCHFAVLVRFLMYCAPMWYQEAKTVPGSKLDLK